jgi:uncharacterized integral membrane protein (TIGR00698 family)
MTLISSTKLAVSLNDGADARREILPGLFLNSVIAGAAYVIRQLPGMAMLSPMILSMVVEIVFHKIVGTTAWAKQGVTFSLRWLLRIAIFPLGLQLTSSQLVEIGGGGLGIIAATVRACFALTVWIGQLLGVEPKLAQLIAAGTSICGASAVIASNTVTNTRDEDVAYAIACVTVFGSVAMFAHPIPADANAWIVAATTFLSIAMAAMGLETDTGKLTAKGLRPILLGALAFLFIAGFSLTLIKLMEYTL